MQYPPITEESPEGSANSTVFEVTKKPERVLVRPEIHFVRAAIYTILALSGVAAIGVGSYFLCKAVGKGFPPSAAGWIGSGSALLILLFFTRKIIPIWFVHIYQRYAPEEMRLRCLYTPSCSEYMILAIQKYGCIRGIIKGIKRLRRCHYPNGGEDYP